MKLSDIQNNASKKSYLSDFVEGPNICIINDLNGEFVKIGNDNVYRIFFDLSIGDKQYKYVSLTPYFIKEDEAMNPSIDNYKIRDILLKLSQFKTFVIKDARDIEANSLPEFIANFKSTFQYKLKCYIYIKKEVSKTGKEYLVIPKLTKGSVLFSSKASSIVYVEINKNDKQVSFEVKDLSKISEQAQTNISEKEDSEQNQYTDNSDDLPF